MRCLLADLRQGITLRGVQHERVPAMNYDVPRKPGFYWVRWTDEDEWPEPAQFSYEGGRFKDWIPLGYADTTNSPCHVLGPCVPKPESLTLALCEFVTTAREMLGPLTLDTKGPGFKMTIRPLPAKAVPKKAGSRARRYQP